MSTCGVNPQTGAHNNLPFALSGAQSSLWLRGGGGGGRRRSARSKAEWNVGIACARTGVYPAAVAEMQVTPGGNWCLTDGGWWSTDDSSQGLGVPFALSPPDDETDMRKIGWASAF